MRLLQIVGLAGCIVLMACVTVNVYFPESAAERAADIFIKDVYGVDEEPPTTPQGEVPQGSVFDPLAPPLNAVAVLLDWLVPAAAAQQVDINISTPAINTLRKAMEQRHRQLKAHYASGAVGMSSSGTIVLRDPKLVGLKQRNTIKKLVVDENADRNRLYKEVAKANGHPEWENDIRGIFASRWVGNAPSGWWYQSGGKWQQK